MEPRTLENNCAWNCLDEPIGELAGIRDEMLHMENRFRDQTESLPQAHRYGTRNLLHYLALRRHDIRPLQEKLALFGLSSLGRCESRALANLNAVLRVADDLTGRYFTVPGQGISPSAKLISTSRRRPCSDRNQPIATSG